MHQAILSLIIIIPFRKTAPLKNKNKIFNVFLE